ncbi:hypothetical protein CW362_40725 [Streptomyces populi]|uniref:Acyl-CoA carboxylase subunit epsilon n=1 Tax=Streptomyces populi TaxID=2058924 RepID=A0A2I0SBV4_9ACTN|nr:acyl-CoA carboxylase epsilon subunit [Streptomyces populi]PKT67394.1 hypothetical protein CW362_40725 [Streptomyces populi]
MSHGESARAVIRVERGEACEEELAALALVLLALRDGGGHGDDDGTRPLAGAHRWRGGTGYRAPDSWR